MDIHFICPKCQQSLVVDRAGAGETIPCPKCEQTIYGPTDYVVRETKRTLKNLASTAETAIRTIFPPIQDNPANSLPGLSSTLPQNSPPKNLCRCSACHEMISREAYTCPHCGDPIRSSTPMIFYVAAVALIVIVALLLLAFGGDILNYISRLQYQ